MLLEAAAPSLANAGTRLRSRLVGRGVSWSAWGWTQPSASLQPIPSSLAGGCHIPVEHEVAPGPHASLETQVAALSLSNWSSEELRQVVRPGPRAGPAGCC